MSTHSTTAATSASASVISAPSKKRTRHDDTSEDKAPGFLQPIDLLGIEVPLGEGKSVIAMIENHRQNIVSEPIAFGDKTDPRKEQVMLSFIKVFKCVVNGSKCLHYMHQVRGETYHGYCANPECNGCICYKCLTDARTYPSHIVRSPLNGHICMFCPECRKNEHKISEFCCLACPVKGCGVMHCDVCYPYGLGGHKHKIVSLVEGSDRLDVYDDPDLAVMGFLLSYLNQFGYDPTRDRIQGPAVPETPPPQADEATPETQEMEPAAIERAKQ